MVDKKRNDDIAPGDETDDILSSAIEEDTNPDDLADDFVEVEDGEEVPEELREEQQDPSTLPKTGLVSEFHDLTPSQAAYLVGHRGTSTVSRSPLLYVSALLLGLAVISALVIGFQQAGDGVGEAPDTLAVVGVEQEQADAFSQQIGLPVVSVEDEAAGEAMLRSGEA